MKPAARSRERGITLIELLAALAVSGFVVAMASRIFLSGHAQFAARSADSEKLALFYRLKAEVEGALKGEVDACAGGRVSVLADSGRFDLEERIRKRIPALVQARFRCLETDAAGTSLQDWQESAQPALIEYGLRIRLKGKDDSLSGSWMP